MTWNLTTKVAAGAVEWSGLAGLFYRRSVDR